MVVREKMRIEMVPVVREGGSGLSELDVRSFSLF